MKLLVLILNEKKNLDRILERWERRGIRDATIISSHDMAKELEGYMDGSFLGSLRATLEPERQENYTVMLAIPDDKQPIVMEVIESVIKLDEPHGGGCVFTVPIDFSKGLKGIEPTKL